MAALTREQWRECRAAWEASEEQGIAWLTVKQGGPFDVSEESIRKRRLAEGWVKVGALGSITAKAAQKADQQPTKQPEMPAQLPVVGLPTQPQPNPIPTQPLAHAPSKKMESEREALDRAEQSALEQSAESERLAVDVRATLLKRHRDEWGLVRNLTYTAIREGNFDKSKQAKISAETFKILQEGERRAYGLDKQDDTGAVVVIERN